MRKRLEIRNKEISYSMLRRIRCSKINPSASLMWQNARGTVWILTQPTQIAYPTRWSNFLVGQNKFGGWNDDGRARFVELRRVIGAAKQKEHV